MCSGAFGAALEIVLSTAAPLLSPARSSEAQQTLGSLAEVEAYFQSWIQALQAVGVPGKQGCLTCVAAGGAWQSHLAGAGGHLGTPAPELLVAVCGLLCHSAALHPWPAACITVVESDASGERVADEKCEWLRRGWVMLADGAQGQCQKAA